MVLKTIIKLINKIVANNSSFKLNYDNLEFYINSAVDYINSELKTEMLNPQEQWESNFIYNNLVYNPSISNTYNYLGKLNECPSYITDNNTIYYSVPDKIYYIRLEGQWVELNLINENLAINDLWSETVTPEFNYTALPENVIRSVLIYYTAASYLEEEDEFESQYKTYLNRAVDNLDKIRQTYYSMYDLEEEHHHHHKPNSKQNPYWISGEDD